MTLATRCPACGTVFRVVQDQLRVSDGWVRCGRCSEVFNAVERLVDLEPESPPLRPSSGSAHRDRVIEDLARVAGHALPAPAPEWPGAANPAAAGLAPPPATAEDSAVAAAAPARTPPPTRPASAPESEAFADSDPDDDAAEAAPAPPPAAELRADPPPFVREAQRAASWRRSPQRLLLAAGVLLAGAALALQVALAYRDLIAARWAIARVPLQAVCAALGCRIEPPRLADGLLVDSSGLVRIDRSPNYRLTVALRNSAPIALAVPAIDLTLTDAQGEVIARRVLQAGELGVTQPSLPGGGELSMKAVLAVAGRGVSGYTIEVFYP